MVGKCLLILCIEGFWSLAVVVVVDDDDDDPTNGSLKDAFIRSIAAANTPMEYTSISQRCQEASCGLQLT